MRRDSRRNPGTRLGLGNTFEERRKQMHADFDREAGRMRKAGAVLIVVWLALVVSGLWLCGSLIASGVKAAKEDCGIRYGIEAVVSGDWFCPDKPALRQPLPPVVR